MSYTRELNVAREAADEAAKIVREFQSAKDFSVNFKGKNDLVTEADIQSEKRILSIIKEHFPDDEVLAEETAQKGSLSKKRTWIIDPIDGTMNFAHGFPIFCISIALWENREPKVGLVLEVSNNEYFTAVEDEGAFLNGSPISVSQLSPQHALIGTGFPYTDLSLIENYLSFFHALMYETQGIRRPGAASYDLCCVACGRFEGFYEYSLSPWDVAAGALIIKEAGGMVSDWRGKDDWLFGERIVTGNPKLHPFLLEKIRGHFTEEEIANVRRET
ncbi:MAG TPA: inositol monophosphatase family protein [Balneolaceae bacterium]